MLFDILGQDLNLDWFWEEVETLPNTQNANHSRSLAIKTRFNLDGSIKNTYQDIAKTLGIKSREQSRQILTGGLKIMGYKWGRYNKTLIIK